MATESVRHVAAEDKIAVLDQLILASTLISTLVLESPGRLWNQA